MFGTTLVELTSGNTGIGIALVAAIKGYKCKMLVPSVCSIERQALIKAFGAELILGDYRLGIQGAFEVVDHVLKNTPDSFYVNQFQNPDNPESHILTTGPEIWSDTDGKVDAVIAGVGTSGTVVGLGKYFNEVVNKKVDIVVVEPEESAVLSGEKPGVHQIQGIGAGIIPDLYTTKYVTEIIKINTKQSFDMAKKLAKEEGILAGISAGAAVQAAINYASRKENEGKNVVVIIPSGGERYLSTNLYKDIIDEIKQQPFYYAPGQKEKIEEKERLEKEQKEKDQKLKEQVEIKNNVTVEQMANGVN